MHMFFLYQVQWWRMLGSGRLHREKFTSIPSTRQNTSILMWTESKRSRTKELPSCQLRPSLQSRTNSASFLLLRKREEGCRLVLFWVQDTSGSIFDGPNLPGSAVPTQSSGDSPQTPAPVLPCLGSKLTACAPLCLLFAYWFLA